MIPLAGVGIVGDKSKSRVVELALALIQPVTVWPVKFTAAPAESLTVKLSANAALQYALAVVAI